MAVAIIGQPEREGGRVRDRQIKKREKARGRTRERRRKKVKEKDIFIR